VQKYEAQGVVPASKPRLGGKRRMAVGDRRIGFAEV